MSDQAVTNPSPRLVGLSFSKEIQRLTEDFVAREWIFDEIDCWLRDSSETFFILTGEAGIGKSAIAARLTQIRDDIAAYNFCITGNNSTIVPGTVLRSLAAQLGENLPEYGLALANTIKPTYLSLNVKIDVGTLNGGQITGVVINNLTIADPRQEIESLLTAPLSNIPAPKQPVLILLDSLDEAFTFSPTENLVTLLAGLNNLPSWARIVLTSRPEKRVLSYFASVPAHILAAESQLNREDLRRFVLHRLSADPFKARLETAQKPVTSDALVERIAGVGDDPGLADGNFLYTKILLNDIEIGLQPLDDLAALPKNLDDIYQRFLQRLAPEWETRYQPLLAVLAVAREPLTRKQLWQFGDQSARLIGGRISATLVNLALDVLVQFLDSSGEPGNEQYALFHQSLRDFLGDPIRSGRYACPPEDGHGAIADYYLEHAAQDWCHCDLYGLQHLPTHLNGAGRTERINELMTDFDWLYAKLEQLDVPALEADFAFSDDADIRLVRDAVRLSTSALMVNKEQLAGQLVGRLSSIDAAGLTNFVQRVRTWDRRLWLCPLTPSLTRPGGALVRILRGRAGGHAGTVRSLAISTDGQRAISAGNSHNDQTVRIWDLGSGMCLSTLPDQAAAGGYTPLALAGSGKRAFTAFQDEVRSWDLEHLAQRSTFTVTGEGVTTLATTADGERVIIGTEVGSVCVWDINTGSFNLGGHGEPICAVAISADGNWAASASGEWVKAWDLTGRKEYQSLNISTGLNVAWGSAKHLWTEADDDFVLFGNPLRRWDIKQAKVTDLPWIPQNGEILAIQPNGQRAIVRDSNEVLGVWDCTRNEKLIRATAPERRIDSCHVPERKVDPQRRFRPRLERMGSVGGCAAPGAGVNRRATSVRGVCSGW